MANFKLRVIVTGRTENRPNSVIRILTLWKQLCAVSYRNACGIFLQIEKVADNAIRWLRGL